MGLLNRVHMLGVVVVFGVVAVVHGVAAQTMDPRFDTDGNLLRPEGYREWIYVGTPVTPNDMNGGKAAFPEFHNVYIHPDSWAHYKKTGTFRNGTILVKELVSVGSKAATSGLGYLFAGDMGHGFLRTQYRQLSMRRNAPCPQRKDTPGNKPKHAGKAPDTKRLDRVRA